MIPKKPDFLEKLNQKYTAQAGNIFLLHGDINDIFLSPDGSWKPLLPLLTKALSRENRIFVHVDLSEGFTILPVWPSHLTDLPEKDRQELAALNPDSMVKELASRRETHFDKQRQLIRKLFGLVPLQEWVLAKQTLSDNYFDNLEQASIQLNFAALVLSKEIFERLLKRPEHNSLRLIFFINDIGTIAPAQNEANLSESDRRNIQLLQKWFSSDDFLGSRHAVIMTGETLESVSPKIRNLAQVTPIKIWRPNSQERLDFIQKSLGEFKEEMILGEGLAIQSVAEATAGLMLRDIDQLLKVIKFGAKRETSDGPIIEKAQLDLTAVSGRAREVMEQSAGGHIEFLELDYGLDDVIGQDRLKPRLAQLARIFRDGKKEAIPSGILVPGPNGGGKTFIFKAFAKETGWLTVRLKNIRNMWYGETERIWELIEEIIEAVGRIIIFVDEGDTELGGRGREVHEVDKRLFGKILRMMEDKKNKGRVCWIIITARPDKLEPDLKRSGRAGRHYPVFAPETLQERQAFTESAVLKRLGKNRLDLTGREFEVLLSLTEKYYPADFEELIEQVREAGEGSGTKEIKTADILEEVRHLRPSDPTLQRQLQIYTALLECTDERLIPAQYLELAQDREKLVKEIVSLKHVLGEIV